jgi:hypothetical protein
MPKYKCNDKRVAQTGMEGFEMAEFLTAKIKTVTISPRMAILDLAVDKDIDLTVGTVLTVTDIINITSRMRRRDRQRIISALGAVVDADGTRI